jgi:hypothetical protein
MGNKAKRETARQRRAREAREAKAKREALLAAKARAYDPDRWLPPGDR